MFEKCLKKRKISNIFSAGGPSPIEQLLAMAEDNYWIVLDTDILHLGKNDRQFNIRVNAFKHSLQTYGPNVPNLIHNTGKAKGLVFHGHIRNSNGTTYVLEWEVIAKERRIMTLRGFGPHENYKYQQTPLDPKDRLNILSKPTNLLILDKIPLKIMEAKNKVNNSLTNKQMR